MTIFRLHIRPGGGLANSEFSFAYCLREQVLGVGWQTYSDIDGATVFDHKGRILAAGAILRIGAGSTGGGRLAVAKAISSMGLGINVSQDGGICGFHDEEMSPNSSSYRT